MADALQKAKEIRKRLRRELRHVDQFISLYREFEQGGTISPIEGARTKVRGRPGETWEAVRAVLSNATAPMSRNDLVRACAASGYVIPGEDQESYVGIVIFRNKQHIKKVKGRYLLRTKAA